MYVHVHTYLKAERKTEGQEQELGLDKNNPYI